MLEIGRIANRTAEYQNAGRVLSSARDRFATAAVYTVELEGDYVDELSAQGSRNL